MGLLPRQPPKSLVFVFFFPYPAATLNHDDGTPFRVLFSVLALSLIERTPESMGEEAVQSIRVGTDSMATAAAAAAKSCAG